MEPLQITKVVAPDEWESTSNIIYDRDALIENSKDFVFSNDLSLCNYLFNRDVMIPKNRIGSESSEGEVYRVNYTIPSGSLKNYEITGAFKILPIMSPESMDKNNTEIIVASSASELVKSGKSKYFPLVYVSGGCNDVTFYQGSKFTRPAYSYACMRKIYNTYPDKSRRIAALEQQKQSAPEILKRIGDNQNLCTDVTIPANFIFSELAAEDLDSWAHKRHTRKAWKEILSGIITGIYDLHSNLGYCHNDLHFGNILITNDLSPNNKLLSYVTYTEIPLIHDFGKSVPLDSENRWEDIRHFFDSMAKLSGATENDYLSQLSTDLLKEYVKLYEDESTHHQIDWGDYESIINVIESS